MSQHRIHRHCLDAIGDTPLVELGRIFDESEGRVLAKLEFTNPGGSKMDRVGRQMLLDARREGSLAPHQTVVELSGGNTAIGLAMCCAVMGHPFVAVLPSTTPSDRVAAIEAYGGQVVLFETPPGCTFDRITAGEFDVARSTVERIIRERGAYRADPSRSLANFRAHRLGTAQEILRQTRGKFNAFCDFVGSGGTFSGCAAAFKEHRADIRCYVVEPEGAAVLSGREAQRSSHGILGGGYLRQDLELLDGERIDGYLEVSEDEAELEVRRLALQEGLLVGWSSGANVAAARKLLAGPRHGETLVVVLADSGMRYLSTSLWGGAAPTADGVVSPS